MGRSDGISELDCMMDEKNCRMVRRVVGSTIE
jgi:hypothetical protein